MTIFYEPMSCKERFPPRELNANWISSNFGIGCIKSMLESEIYQNSYDYQSQYKAAYTFLHLSGLSKNKVARLFSANHKDLIKNNYYNL